MSPASEAARALLAATRVAALATAHESEVASTLIAIADDGTGSPLSVLSGLSEHTRLLRRSPLASVMVFDETHGAGGVLDRRRLTLSGRFRFLEGAQRVTALETFVSRHPEAARYVQLADFVPARLDVQRVRWVGGFAAAASLRAEEYLGLGTLPAAEELAALMRQLVGGPRAHATPKPTPSGVDVRSAIARWFPLADQDYLRLQLERSAEPFASADAEALLLSRDRTRALLQRRGGSLEVMTLTGTTWSVVGGEE